MPPKTRIQVLAEPSLVDWLTARADAMGNGEPIAGQARLELDLWLEHLAAELRATTWTLPEIGCIADVLNRPVIDASVGALLWADLAHAFEGLDGAYGDKWGIDEDALIAKARKLGPTACHALTAAIAQWWDLDADHTAEGWRRVGVRCFTDG